MSRGPKGERRPRDVIGNAVHVMRIATGQITDDVPTPEDEGKNPAAVALGRMGGKARAAKLSAKKRKEMRVRPLHLVGKAKFFEIVHILRGTDCYQADLTLKPRHGGAFSDNRSVAMPTSKEYRHRADECLRLANETKEIFARMAMFELAAEFRAMAQQLELRERRANTKQRFSSAAVRIGP